VQRKRRITGCDDERCAPNTTRFLEAFDFASLAENQVQAQKTLSVSAFRFQAAHGTRDALSRLMWKENEKPNIQSGALPVITAETFTTEVWTAKKTAWL
jgi:hypothetical protein